MGIFQQIAENAVDSLHNSVSENASNRRVAKEEARSMEYERRQAEQEMELDQVRNEKEKMNDLSSRVQNVYFDPKDVDGIEDGLSELINVFDAISEDGISEDEIVLFQAVKKKYNSGLSMLQTVDPSNRLLAFFQSKMDAMNDLETKAQDEKKKSKKKAIIGVCVALGVSFFLILLLSRVCA